MNLYNDALCCSLFFLSFFILSFQEKMKENNMKKLCTISTCLFSWYLQYCFYNIFLHSLIFFIIKRKKQNIILFWLDFFLNQRIWYYLTVFILHVALSVKRKLFLEVRIQDLVKFTDCQIVANSNLPLTLLLPSQYFMIAK